MITCGLRLPRPALGWVEVDGVAEQVGLCVVMRRRNTIGVASGEVVGAEVVVVDVVGVYVPDGGQDRVFDGVDGSLFAAAGDDAPVAGGRPSDRFSTRPTSG
jgi:hypothetical protein